MKQVLSKMSKSFGACMDFTHCYLCLSHSAPDIPVVELPEVVPYFDLEGFPGVEELKREKDATSEPISIPLGLLFGDRIVTIAYVSTLVHCSIFVGYLKILIELTCGLGVSAT